MNLDHVVTRFAPSPTGFLHVGGVRTALFAWLFARKHGGTFILRIEDTDKEREVVGSIDHIVESLEWLGITWDQGPIKQSDRLDSYQKYARILFEKGYAYPDPYTEQEVEGFRVKAEEEKRPFLYREYRPKEILPWDGKKPLRFRVPEIKRYEWNDMVRGILSAGEEALDDFILLKGDGYPTYNFAHIVDDFEMGVTHIMRAEEFISSTPKFLSLYDALGFTRPSIATMPVILGPDGKKKLSKRDGAKDVLDYRKEGYCPEAVVNFLALIGWHPEGDQEVMTISELIQNFNVSRLQKGGAKFNEEKLRWFNHIYIQGLSPDAFIARLEGYVKAEKKDFKLPSYTYEIAHLLQQRCTSFQEVVDTLQAGEFSFLEEYIPPVSPALLIQGAKADQETVRHNLQEVVSLLKDCTPFTEEFIKEKIFPFATEVGRSSVLWPLRVALSGQEKSPDPFTLAALLGLSKTIERVETAAQLL